MKLYPAIDVLDGRVVRLTHGDFNAVTDYGGDPVGAAEGYRAAGAEWLHLVDLSGARDGARRQRDLVAALVKTGLYVQTGGGVRSAADIEAILEAGAARAVIGSLAVSEPETVIGWIKTFGPEHIVAALDARVIEGEPTPVMAGWTQDAPAAFSDLARAYAEAGLAHALATDVSRDGTLSGPNTALYKGLSETFPEIAWQASGGIAQLSDLSALREAGAAAAVVGKAFYENRFTCEEAMACLQNA